MAINLMRFFRAGKSAKRLKKRLNNIESLTQVRLNELEVLIKSVEEKTEDNVDTLKSLICNIDRKVEMQSINNINNANHSFQEYGESGGASQHPAQLSPTAIFNVFLRAMEENAVVRVTINRAELWLPRDTLRTMVHCIQYEPGGNLVLWVEANHLDWMISKLSADGCFIDVGVATGAIALPIAKQFGNDVRIIAFEPSRAAHRLLLETLRQNGIDTIEVRQCAVADQPGTAPFLEYPQDESGTVPFLPEASTLQAGDNVDPRTQRYDVEVTTLDLEFAQLDVSGPTVIKIDVEGFEAKVLSGATQFIRRVYPFFSIDIHSNPFGPGMTDDDVRSILEPMGYSCKMMGHVLLAEPDPVASSPPPINQTSA